MQKLPKVSLNKIIKNLQSKEKIKLFLFMVIKKSVD